MKSTAPSKAKGTGSKGAKTAGSTSIVPVKAETTGVKKAGDAPVAGRFGRAMQAVLRTRAVQAVLQTLNKFGSSPVAWTTITCSILAVSAAIRFSGEFQHYTRLHETRDSPFPLAEIPRVLGSWRMDEADKGEEIQLNPETAKIAGSTDNFVRFYTDDRSGQTVGVIVSYGPASVLTMHVPDVCYPASGFEMEQMNDFDMEVPGLEKRVHYRGGVYSKNFAGRTGYQEVLYAFRHAGDSVGARQPDGRCTDTTRAHSRSRLQDRSIRSTSNRAQVFRC